MESCVLGSGYPCDVQREVGPGKGRDGVGGVGEGSHHRCCRRRRRHLSGSRVNLSTLIICFGNLRGATG